MTPYRRLDTKIAPKVKAQYQKVLTRPKEIELEEAVNYTFKMNPSAVELFASSESKQMNSLNLELAKLKAQLGNVANKVTNALDNPSSPFSVNLSDLQNEQSKIQNKINTAEQTLKSFTDKMNPKDPNTLPRPLELKRGYPFYLSSRKYRDFPEKPPLRDTWEFSFVPKTAKDVLDILLVGGEDMTTTLTTDESVIVSGGKGVDPEVADLTKDYKFFPHVTEKDQVFANIMREKWEQVNGGFVIDFDEPYHGGTFFPYFREKRPFYYASVVNMLGAEISNTTLFNVSDFSDLELGENIQIDKNNCDNLLVLEDLKKEAKKQYDNVCDDNDSSSSPGALENANLINLMRASIRVSIIQMVSESIFFLSRFSFEKTITDPAAVQFILTYIASDMQKQDSEFYSEILNQAEKFLEKRKKDGDKLIDPFLNSDEPDPLLTQDEVQQVNYLQYMIKEEMKKMGPLIDKKLMTPATDINDIFLNNIVPNIDVAWHKDQNRFHAATDVNVYFPNGSGFDTNLGFGTQVTPKNKFKFLNPVDPLFKGSGGFILERYIRLEDSDLIVDNNNNITEHEKVFGQFWFNRPGGRNNSDADADNLKSIEFNNSDLDSNLDFAHTSGVVNKNALLAQLQKIDSEWRGSQPFDPSLIDINKFVKNFKFGLRLVYIPPSVAGSLKYAIGAQSNIQTISQVFDIAENLQKPEILYESALITTEEAIEQAKSEEIAGRGPFTDATFREIFAASVTMPEFNNPNRKYNILTEVARSEKAYALTETLATLVPTNDIMDAPKDAEESFLLLQLEANTTEIYPVPVITLEEDLGLFDTIKSETGRVTLESLISALESTIITDAAYSGLKNKMKTTNEYKLLFDYDIPLKRAMTQLLIHNVVTSTKNYPEIKDAYSQTKDLIRGNFFNMIPGNPWWSKQDKEIEAAGGNSGIMADQNNSMTAQGPSGSAMAKKIAAKALMIIIKAYARQTDPHYKIMSLLDDFGLTIDGMTWLSVPPLYPVNFPLPFPPWIGWGPPMTPAGMIAYSLPLLPGEVKKKKERQKEQGEQIDDSSCEDNKSE